MYNAMPAVATAIRLANALSRSSGVVGARGVCESFCVREGAPPPIGSGVQTLPLPPQVEHDLHTWIS
jgi:hypothetical protein